MNATHQHGIFPLTLAIAAMNRSQREPVMPANAGQYIELSGGRNFYYICWRLLAIAIGD
jgi:hypothetical protein